MWRTTRLLSDQQNDWTACHRHHLELLALYLQPCWYRLHKQTFTLKTADMKASVTVIWCKAASPPCMDHSTGCSSVFTRWQESAPPICYIVPWDHTSLMTKQDLDRFSHVCRAQLEVHRLSANIGIDRLSTSLPMISIGHLTSASAC